MADPKLRAQYFLTGTLLCLSAALVYLAVILARVVNALSAAIEASTRMGTTVERAVDESQAMRAAIPGYLERADMIAGGAHSAGNRGMYTPPRRRARPWACRLRLGALSQKRKKLICSFTRTYRRQISLDPNS
jgi:hypothetical protein